MHFSPIGWADIIATALVLLGCCGEIWAACLKSPFNPTNSAHVDRKFKKWLEIVSLALVSIGVLGEVAVLPKTLKEASDLNANVEQLRSNNLVLQNDIVVGIQQLVNTERTNAMLKLAARPRWQRFDANLFTSILAGPNEPRTKIEILFGPDDNSATFGTATAHFLGDCGWNVISCREYSESDAIDGWQKGSALAPPSLSDRVGALWGGFGFVFRFPPPKTALYDTNTPCGLLFEALTNADMPFHESTAYIFGDNKLSNGVMRLVIPPNQ